ncbi:Sulfurtransferase [Rhynchospora pubera]|uniref:Sulfurtransferase n=1 Tax=Rhynchospora pubera TaxID=906938 RepID=A0AAV8G4J6_9POAL|nr:Sulfurtransferase [Rhynchospora pubera]
MDRDDAVVSVEWLHQNLENPEITVLDASWYMPFENRDPFQEYKEEHIPGALFFDVDNISDLNTDLPHMLPSEEAFASAVTALGITNDDKIVVYDGKGMYSAPRLWWTFRVFGHDNIWVLDGGFPKWRSSGFEVQSSDSSSNEVSKSSSAIRVVEQHYKENLASPATFKVLLRPHLIWTLDKIKQNIEDKTHQHIDARVRGRFDGTAPEPRKGVRSGHIPGSKCVPFPDMLNSEQLFLPRDEIQKRFEKEGVSLENPIVVSCATGVTACIVALGLYKLGKKEIPVYDGSWTEWECQPGAIIVTVNSASSS